MVVRERTGSSGDVPDRSFSGCAATSSGSTGIDAIRSLIDERHHPHGYNVGFNDGPAAGQTIMHFHVHVIPRYSGDTTDPRGGVRWVLPDKAAYWLKPNQ